MNLMKKYLVITGGVGGAKLALGLTKILSESEVAFLVNTGDDFEHMGLSISPDLDTLMYTLSGLSNVDLGWGREGETWRCLEAYKRLGGDSWFNLGDEDLAVHLRRTELLKQGWTLSDVTTELFRSLGVYYSCWPMSDGSVRTYIETEAGCLEFQHYFVRDRCEHEVKSIHFVSSAVARPAGGLVRYLEDPDLNGIIICPSNPFLSIDPILSVPELKEALIRSNVPIIAVSPLINGQSIKGPTSKIMNELDLVLSPVSVALHYADLITGFIIDDIDKEYFQTIQELGLSVVTTQTLMNSLDDRVNLAQTAVKLCDKIRGE
jgi:LPPG:FO 2-phospho-L-lactate transferase